MEALRNLRVALNIDSAELKHHIAALIKHNGGSIAYVVTRLTDLVVTENEEGSLPPLSVKLRYALQYGVPVVAQRTLCNWLEEDDHSLPFWYKSSTLNDELTKIFSLGRNINNEDDGNINDGGGDERDANGCFGRLEVDYVMPDDESRGAPLIRPRLYNPESSEFPEHLCQVLRADVFQRVDLRRGRKLFFAMEIHFAEQASAHDIESYFRVFVHSGDVDDLSSSSNGKREVYDVDCIEDAELLYADMFNSRVRFGWTRLHLQGKLVGSNLAQASGISIGDDGVADTVESQLAVDVYNDSLSELARVEVLLGCPLGTLSLVQVEKAQVVLLESWRYWNSGSSDLPQLKKLSEEYYSNIPHLETPLLDSRKIFQQEKELLQLLHDMLNLGEAVPRSLSPSQLKLRALGCSLQRIDPSSDSFIPISKWFEGLQVCNAFAVSRKHEMLVFRHGLHNKQILFHGSKCGNWSGLLSRGMMMPHMVVDRGGTRTDYGMLGAGIYFASEVATTLQYSTAGSRGTRFVLCCEVALGTVKDLTHEDPSLTTAPDGYHSVHGKKSTASQQSDFAEDEYVIYDSKQQRMCYLVEIAIAGDRPSSLVTPQDSLGFKEDVTTSTSKPISLHALRQQNPAAELPNTKKTQPAGLRGDAGAVPLKSVNVKAKCVDMVAQVVVFQEYFNEGLLPIEAKYVFPLDEMAAVCGFEAFINGKHIIGKVKEKETAHKEYREAVAAGHGAYLMDEDTEKKDVFTVSVGNLPAQAAVLIKITYVTELSVFGPNIQFLLPATVFPPSQETALDIDTQQTTETLASDSADCGLSLELGIDMPYEIVMLKCDTHPIVVKQTETKASVRLKYQDKAFLSDFKLSIRLSKPYEPRLTVEEGPDGSYAGMVAFYPQFEYEPPPQMEVVLVIDRSASMGGTPMQDAKKVAAMFLAALPTHARWNIVEFGSSFEWMSCELMPCNDKSLRQGIEKINEMTSSYGGSDACLPLAPLILSAKNRSATTPRNVIVISDGYLTQSDTLLQLIRQSAGYYRIFAVGVGSTPNRFLVRKMAVQGGGSSAFIRSSDKDGSKKVAELLSRASQPALTNIAVEWVTHDVTAKITQCPKVIPSLFSGQRQIVYGFIPHCIQAKLRALAGAKELETGVTTHELRFLRGQLIHRLCAKAMIREWDDGALFGDAVETDVKKREVKSDITSMAIRYSLVSPFTSFVAVEERGGNEEDAEKRRKVPAISDLVEQEQVDNLGYMDWQEVDEHSLFSEGQSTIDEKHDEAMGPFDFTTNIDDLSYDSSEGYVRECLSRARALLDGGKRAPPRQLLGTAYSVAVEALPATHPLRLQLFALMADICYDAGRIHAARMYAKNAFDDAIAQLDTLAEDSYKESTVHLQRLRDKLTAMTPPEHKDSDCGAETQPLIEQDDPMLHLNAPVNPIFTPEEIDVDEVVIKQRNAEIAQIETDLVQLNEMFADLGSIVAEQGEIIERSIANIETSELIIAENQELDFKTSINESDARSKREDRKLETRKQQREERLNRARASFSQKEQELDAPVGVSYSPTSPSYSPTSPSYSPRSPEALDSGGPMRRRRKNRDKESRENHSEGVLSGFFDTRSTVDAEKNRPSNSRTRSRSRSRDRRSGRIRSPEKPKIHVPKVADAPLMQPDARLEVMEVFENVQAKAKGKVKQAEAISKVREQALAQKQAEQEAKERKVRYKAAERAREQHTRTAEAERKRMSEERKQRTMRKRKEEAEKAQVRLAKFGTDGGQFSASSSSSEVSLAFQDESGEQLSAKEAFRSMSHRFHGKVSDIDKKKKKPPAALHGVKLMDGTVKRIAVDPQQTAQSMMEKIGNAIGLTNTEEYGLVVEGTNKYLSSTQSLEQQGVDCNAVLKFKKRFFVDDANVDRSDPIQLHLVYLQSRDAVVSGEYPVDSQQACKFAAVQLQIEHGNFTPGTHDRQWFQSMCGSCLPPAHRRASEFTLVSKEWKKCTNTNKISAYYRYVQMCRQLPTYGITTFSVKEKRGGQLATVLLGITRSDILIIDNQTREILRTYPLSHVRRWAAAKSTFTLDFGTYQSEYLTLETTRGEEISQLLTGYIDILLKHQQAAEAHQQHNEHSAVIEDLAPLMSVPEVATLANNVGSCLSTLVALFSQMQLMPSGCWPLDDKLMRITGLSMQSCLALLPIPKSDRTRSSTLATCLVLAFTDSHTTDEEYDDGRNHTILNRWDACLDRAWAFLDLHDSDGHWMLKAQQLLVL